MAGVLKYKDPSTNEWVRVSAPTSDISVDNVMQMELLWENPNTIAEFDAQDIDVVTNGYDYLVIDFVYHTTTPTYVFTEWLTVGKSRQLLSTTDYTKIIQRDVKNNSTNLLTVAACTVNGTVNNAYNIPYRIYGIKNTDLTVNNSNSNNTNNTQIITSNPNLLDNWYFVDPINQRGQTEYTGAAYTIDRWRTNFSGDTVTITDKGVKNLNTSTSYGWHMHQIIEDGVKELIGKNITASVLIEEFTNSKLIPIVSFRNSNDAEISVIKADSTSKGLVTFSGVVPSDTAKIRFGFYAYSGTVSDGDYFTIKAAKLELGSVQTLAHQEHNNWVLNDPPPNKHYELAKCQRYYYRIYNKGNTNHFGTAFANTAGTSVYGLVKHPVPMRVSPTIKFSGLEVWNGRAGHVSITSVEKYAEDEMYSMVTLNATPSTVLNKGEGCAFSTASGAGNYIEFSADL